MIKIIGMAVNFAYSHFVFIYFPGILWFLFEVFGAFDTQENFYGVDFYFFWGHVI